MINSDGDQRHSDKRVDRALSTMHYLIVAAVLSGLCMLLVGMYYVVTLVRGG